MLLSFGGVSEGLFVWHGVNYASPFGCSTFPCVSAVKLYESGVWDDPVGDGLPSRRHFRCGDFNLPGIVFGSYY